MKMEHIGSTLVVVSALIFLGSYALPQLNQYKKWAEYGAIAGVGLYVLGMVM